MKHKLQEGLSLLGWLGLVGLEGLDLVWLDLGFGFGFVLVMHLGQDHTCLGYMRPSPA